MSGHNIWHCELCGNNYKGAGIGSHLSFRHDVQGIETEVKRNGLGVKLHDGKVVARLIRYQLDIGEKFG